jgi:hypothetical protein
MTHICLQGIPSETISALVSVVPVPLPELPEAHIQASIVSARVIKLQLSAMTRAGVSIQQGHLEQVYAVLNEKVESSDGPLCVCLDDLSLIELLYGIDAAAKLLRRLHGLTARYSVGNHFIRLLSAKATKLLLHRSSVWSSSESTAVFIRIS